MQGASLKIREGSHVWNPASELFAGYLMCFQVIYIKGLFISLEFL